MKKTKFTESQIIKAIKEAENGRPVAEVSRELGINPPPSPSPKPLWASLK